MWRHSEFPFARRTVRCRLSLVTTTYAKKADQGLDYVCGRSDPNWQANVLGVLLHTNEPNALSRDTLRLRKLFAIAVLLPLLPFCCCCMFWWWHLAAAIQLAERSMRKCENVYTDRDPDRALAPVQGVMLESSVLFARGDVLVVLELQPGGTNTKKWGSYAVEPRWL